MRKWSKEAIATEIARLHEANEDLSYAAVAQNHVALLRAATRYYGSWRAAVEQAGVGYEGVRKYQTWTGERILERIRALHAAGTDLSWRHVSTQVDPQLAAAATKRQHFGSWRAAIEAAGLDYASVRRYRKWSEQAIIDRLKELHAQGVNLNAKNMEETDITLITAARRRFDSWHLALEAAGLDYHTIVLRRPFKRRRKGDAADAPQQEQ